MTSTELVPVAAGHAPTMRRRRAEPDVRAANGTRLSASAARKLRDAVPRNSRDARATREQMTPEMRQADVPDETAAALTGVRRMEFTYARPDGAPLTEGDFDALERLLAAYRMANAAQGSAT